MSTPIILILGAGPNIGQSVAQSFAAKGYKVAFASRSLKDGLDKDGHLQIRLDLADPHAVAGAFEKVTQTFGIPSVVVYNAALRTLVHATDPLSNLTVDDFSHHFAVNATSALFAAQQAVRGFKALPDAAARTFIFTGNKLNVLAKPDVLPFGMGKSAVAHMVHSASVAYRERGFKFYYVDERKQDGDYAGAEVDGPAAGDVYVRLAEEKAQGPWLYTFVKGVGYVDFGEINF